jgi:beta-galactosidase
MGSLIHLRRWVWAAWLLASAISAGAGGSRAVPFDDQWRFSRADDPQATQPEFDDRTWEPVNLPHTARVEALVTGGRARQWQGICWYRKTFELPAESQDKSVFLRFEGAMNVASVWINGQAAGTFQGGYLPYVMDISKLARAGVKNVVSVRLDNRDNPITGPKPLADLDFNLYGGLYRNASLIIKDKLHITDPILADKIAGGGVFVTFPAVATNQATLRVRTHVRNADGVARSVVMRTTLLNAREQTVAAMESASEVLPSGTDREVVQEFQVANPKLWSPKSPHLYQVRSELLDRGRIVDAANTRVGIRRIEISPDGFRINGEKMFLRGVNRHQEYPYIGNAVPEAAQYRDARKIKESGFDYVRLSHYPQSPAFLDACDELGLVVMNSIMGWQYFNQDPAFAGLKYQECRQLIRRDRNHPSVILWEVSLNESTMPAAFVQRANAIAHEEYPGDQCLTSGWVNGYDVFIQARQHGGCRAVTNRPCVVSEYGDWEYYAQNAGFQQHQWKDLQPAARSSRQLRGDGEIRLLQQALNFQEAHNDNLKTSAFADGLWVMYDYNRGYAPDLESSGVMDVFRLPKFSYWFFRSQRDSDEPVAGDNAGPVLFIANYWTPDSPLEVRVFSNCDEVALYLNGKLIERRRPDASPVSTHLRHPPFTFQPDRFEPGTLQAVGYLAGREVARCERCTPGEIAGLALRFDLGGKPFAAGRKDVVFCLADVRDASGTVVPTARVPVFFGTSGQLGRAKLIGHNPILSEAGTAGILLESDSPHPLSAVYAIGLLKENNQTRILSAGASPDGTKPPEYKVCYTTDGTEPSITSPVYSQPVPNVAELRAAILVEGQIVAIADSRASARSTCDLAALTTKATAASP